MYVVRVFVFTRDIADCLVRCLANRINLFAFISQRKIAAVAPNHWSLTKIKLVASRFDAASLVGLNTTRLNSTLLVCTPSSTWSYAGSQIVSAAFFAGLDSTRHFMGTHPLRGLSQWSQPLHRYPVTGSPKASAVSGHGNDPC